jgi:quinol monooxygenase YgiN
MAALVPPVVDRMHPSISDAELRNRSIDGVEPSGSGVTSTSVQSSFLVSPRHADLWIEIWKGLATLAEATPGCRHFRLARDRNDSMYFAIYSEWADVTSYAAFEQQKRVKHIEQDLAAISFPKEARFLEILPAQPAATKRKRHDA